MTGSQLRRARKAKLAAHVAAGTHVPHPGKSRYLTVDIRDVVTEHIRAQREMMDAHRRVSMDPSWQYDEETAAQHRLKQELQSE